MSKTINGIVTWLKNWFYTKSEIDESNIYKIETEDKYFNYIQDLKVEYGRPYEVFDSTDGAWTVVKITVNLYKPGSLVFGYCMSKDSITLTPVGDSTEVGRVHETTLIYSTTAEVPMVFGAYTEDDELYYTIPFPEIGDIPFNGAYGYYGRSGQLTYVYDDDKNVTHYTFPYGATTSGYHGGTSVKESIDVPVTIKEQLGRVSNSKLINTGDDLNDYVETGFYYSPNMEVSKTLVNCPATRAFALLVEKSRDDENACTQTLTTYDGWRIRKFIRSFVIDNSNLLDSGWRTLYDDVGFEIVELTNKNFGLYTSGKPMRIRRIGDIVQFNGILKNTSAITLNTSEVKIAYIPSEYRPAYDVYGIMQGSGTNIFLLHITTTGDIKLSRYRANTTSYSSISSGAWFPMHITYMI